METRVGIRIDGDAAGAVSASSQTERALDAVADAAKDAGRNVNAGMAQVVSGTQAAGAATDNLAAKQAALAKQAKLVAFQNQQLAFQLNDFFVQVASGQSPIIAAIQQGSQLSGTYRGIGNAVRAVTALITPARVAIGGLAGAVIGLSAASVQGYLEQRELARSLVLTGGAVGQTLGQLENLAQRVSANNQTSIAGARETMAALVATGRVQAGSLESMVTVVEKVTALSGRAREDVIKEFATMAKDGPTKFAEEANKSYNFLSVEQFRYIKQLEEQGQASQAMVVVSDALNARLGSMASNLGTLEQAWASAKNSASDFWDVLKGIGREQTPEGALANLRKQSELASARRGQLGVTVKSDPYAQEIANASELVRINQRAVSAKAEQAFAAKQAIDADQKWGRLKDQNLSKQKQLNKALEEAGKLAKARNKMDELPAMEAAIRARFKGSSGNSAAQINQEATAQYNLARAQLEGIAAAEKRSVDARLKNREQLYKLGLVDIRSYYAEKTALEQESIAVQAKLVQGELAQAKIAQDKATRPADKLAAQTRVAQLENQLAELQARKDDVRLTNDNAKAQQLDAQLREIESRMDAAEIKGRQAVFEQQIAGRDRIANLKIDQIKDPEARERAMMERRKQKMRELVEASTVNESDRLDAIKTINEEMALENDALAERFKPGWQKMLAEWGNSAALMKTSYDDAIMGMLRSGEQEFIRSKGNIGSTFKAMLKELEADLLRFAYKNSIGQLLGGGKSGGGGGGGIGGLLGGLFRGVSFNPFGGGGFTDVGGLGSAASSFLATILHTGGMGSDRGAATRLVSPSIFDRAPRFHQGVGPGERAAIIRTDEGVFTPSQMRALAPVGQGSGNVQVTLINQSGQQLDAQASRRDDGSLQVILRQVKDSVAGDIANGEGAVYGALQSRFGLRTAVA